ncbi:uncharacterized protein LOC115216301 [Octopus sinensis]|uniref:Uncharacterized protein LOC115216301 n=1 Tax=Octopus sinensis TaxID=2607531 RepID=A0A6P7ST35_9MOLL|nr:uncharacterized protein LOC115216301 [Octopus sinensis]
MGKTQIKEWYIRLKHGQTWVENEAGSSKPSTGQSKELIENVRRIITKRCHVTNQEITHEGEISTGSVHSILTGDLCMQRESEKFLPKVLTAHQKQHHLEIAQDMVDCANQDPDFMETILSGDETWIYGLFSMRSVILRNNENLASSHCMSVF